MREEEKGSESPQRHRSRSPINRDRSSPKREKTPEEEESSSRESPRPEMSDPVKAEELKSPFDSYSASLRLASLETLTGKPPTSLGLPFPFMAGLTPSKPEPTSPHKVPKDEPALPLQDALANFQKTASESYSSMMANPLQQLLAAQGGLGGLGNLPKPADLIQQAQTLQLLAHLQTMLMNPNVSQASSAPSLSGPLNNATNFQKVGFIHKQASHIYDLCQVLR